MCSWAAYNFINVFIDATSATYLCDILQYDLISGEGPHMSHAIYVAGP